MKNYLLPLVKSALSVLLLSVPFFANAGFEFTGTKLLFARMADQTEIQIGEVVFKEEPLNAGSSRFTLHLDHSKFTDYFLSMREFKCLPSEKEVSCHVPYPYEAPNVVSDDNYAWLEHRLMFLFKKPSEFGAKLWNGIYFQFSKNASELVGTPQAVDLNHIGAPPDDLTLPPYGPFDRHEMPADERWIQALIIR